MGFIPAYLTKVYVTDPFFARTATLFTIHNLAYQGIFDPNLVLIRVRRRASINTGWSFTARRTR